MIKTDLKKEKPQRQIHTEKSSAGNWKNRGRTGRKKKAKDWALQHSENNDIHKDQED